MTERDPNQEVLKHIEEHGFYKQSVKLEMDAFMDKELERQKDSGIIEGDSQKINIEAMEEHKPKPWQKVSSGAFAAIVGVVVLSAIVIAIVIAKNGGVPSFLEFLNN